MSSDLVNFEDSLSSEDNTLSPDDYDDCYNPETTIDAEKFRLISETQSILKDYQQKFCIRIYHFRP